MKVEEELDDLVIRFQKKDMRAFEKLYNMYKTNMHGVIFNIVRDEAIADDVLQEVFVKIWQNADSYSSRKGRFFTWILNISRNAAIDKIRSKAFSNSQKNLDATFFVDILHSDEDLDGKTDAIGIKNFVLKLGDKCREVINAIYFLGFTQREASEELAIPLGTIKTRNRNCLSELRGMMDN